MNPYTPPESVQLLLEKQPSLLRFRRALRRADQEALDSVLAMAASAPAVKDPAAHTLLEVILLGMLMVEQQQLGQLSDLLNQTRPSDGRPAPEE